MSNTKMKWNTIAKISMDDTSILRMRTSRHTYAKLCALPSTTNVHVIHTPNTMISGTPSNNHGLQKPAISISQNKKFATYHGISKNLQTIVVVVGSAQSRAELNTPNAKPNSPINIATKVNTTPIISKMPIMKSFVSLLSPKRIRAIAPQKNKCGTYMDIVNSIKLIIPLLELRSIVTSE